MNDPSHEQITPPFGAFAAAFASALIALSWSRLLEPWLLVASALAIAAALILMVRRRSGGAYWLFGAAVPLLGALIVGAVAERDFRRIEFDWEHVAAEREQRLAARLGDVMSDLTRRGEQAVQSVAEAEVEDDQIFALLDEVRCLSGVDALALFDSDGALIAWAGDHRGTIPDAIRVGEREAYFTERPLYSYLYFGSQVKGTSRRVVAAVLVETGAIPRAGEPGLATTLAARADVPAVFRSGPGGAASAWSFFEDGDTVVHARLEPFTQAEVRRDREMSARRWGVAAAFLALMLVSVGWLHGASFGGRTLASLAPLTAAAVAVAIAPLGEVLGLEGRISTLAFLIPVPGMSLGDVLAMLLAAAALVATLDRRIRIGRGWTLAAVVTSVALGAFYAATLRGLLSVATPSLLEGGNALWYGIQLSAFLLLVVTTALILPDRRPVEDQPPFRIPLLISALLVAALLAALVQAMAYERHEPLPWFAMLWAIPMLLLAMATTGSLTSGQRLARWVSVGFIAATAVLPQLWGANTQARLGSAERELATFGINTPPIVEYRLDAFSREVVERVAAGESGLQLLYRSWVASGLAQEPYPVRITQWQDGEPSIELRLGEAEGSDAASSFIRTFVEQGAQLDSARSGSLEGLPGVNWLLTIPLDSQRVISVTVAPRRSLQRGGIIAPFLGGTVDPAADVTLVPPLEATPAAGSIEWRRSRDGWRSEAEIAYPTGPQHAHLEVRFTPTGMRLARGTLLITFDLALLILLWAAGHLARGLRVAREGTFRGWLQTYRARVTIALFVFFLMPTALFGWIAYGGLSSVVREVAGTVAARAVHEAVLEWPQSEGRLRDLSERSGADVLYYLGGELIDASSPEGMALGVYGAWMGAAAYRTLSGGDDPTTSEINRLETLSYLTAYETLPPSASSTFAVPVALSVGDTATRQRDIADLTLLAAILGLLLSGVLSIAVGRALAGPIGQLRRAAAAVGRGHLGVRLPEPAGGEFGQVFSSFNRMVRRLRRARAQEVRTARVLAWGEMARQIAHEIKNPLTPIKLAVQHLRRTYRDGRSDFGKTLDENVDQILTEINRLTEISRAFSRYGAPPQQAGPLTDVDVAAVIREAMTLYRAGDTNVRYTAEVETGLPTARARGSELREVLMNLLENARDAVGERGEIAVTAGHADGILELAVRDDGPGIPAELVPRIFDPHFSTRSSGTGLGLAIVRRLVENWGGTVDVESRLGHGATFVVRIPAGEPD